MKPRLRVAFTRFWRSFTPDDFAKWFPFVAENYELVLSRSPEVVFYSVFSLRYRRGADPREMSATARYRRGNYVRVFVTGENVEPLMDECEFAIGFSSLVDHPNFLRLPLWVVENRGWGFGPERLVKPTGTDWERVAAEKTGFCNFVYSWDVRFRNAIAERLGRYKRVDAAGRVMNNMDGWRVPHLPNRTAGKTAFLRRYKFTLAVENCVWPGYATEKLVDPMYVDSIPIYLGDPQASATFDAGSYVDVARFGSLAHALEFVREVDNDRALYMKMLSTPWYRGNVQPAFTRDDTIAAFFDRIFAAALARRSGRRDR
jgi:hypothetical protein